MVSRSLNYKNSFIGFITQSLSCTGIRVNIMPQYGHRYKISLDNIYRPQRSCRKVMFLHLSVIVHGGGGLCPGRRGSLSRGGGSLSGGGLCPGGSLSGRFSPREVTCGRYASYWKAFFYMEVFTLQPEMIPGTVSVHVLCEKAHE